MSVCPCLGLNHLTISQLHASDPVGHWFRPVDSSFSRVQQIFGCPCLSSLEPKYGNTVIQKPNKMETGLPDNLPRYPSELGVDTETVEGNIY